MSTFLTNTSTPQDSEQQQFIREIIGKSSLIQTSVSTSSTDTGATENAMVLCPGVVRANPTTASIHLFSVDVPIRRGLFQARLVRNDTNEVVLKGERVSSAFEAISMLHVRCIPTDAARCDLNGLSIGELHQQIKGKSNTVRRLFVFGFLVFWFLSFAACFISWKAGSKRRHQRAQRWWRAVRRRTLTSSFRPPETSSRRRLSRTR
jgi:hypothetical protein